MDRLPQSANKAARWVSRVLVDRMGLPPNAPQDTITLLDETLVPTVKLMLYHPEFVRWLQHSGVLPKQILGVLRHCLCTRCQLAPRLDDNTLCQQCLEEDDRG